MIHYYRCEDGYVGVTEESPKGLRSLVCAGRGPLPGKGIESVCEQGYAINQLDKMEKIAADDVPNDWFAAIGYEKRLPPEPEPHVVPVTIELPGDRLRRMILAKPGTADHDRWRRDRVVFWVALAISLAVWWWIVFVWQYR